MTKVTQPLGSSEARGALGGLVYNTCRGISYVRDRVAPTGQGSAARAAVRNLAKQCTIGWKALSQDQRSAWDYWATEHLSTDWTGNQVRLSGYNWYLRANIGRLMLSLAMIDWPPLRANPQPPSSFSAARSGATIVTAWTLFSSCIPADYTLDLAITPPQSLGRIPKLSVAKHYAYIPAADLAYTTAALGPGRYGLFARTIDEITGLPSPWLSAEVVIPAASYVSGTPRTPSVAESGLPVVYPWSKAMDACAEDAILAYSAFLEPDWTDEIIFSTFNLDLPSGATITDIIPDFKIALTEQGQVEAVTYLAGVPRGTPFADIFSPQALAWSAFQFFDPLWGTTWTAAQVNDQSFGIGFKFQSGEGSGGAAFFDALTLTINFTV